MFSALGYRKSRPAALSPVENRPKLRGFGARERVIPAAKTWVRMPSSLLDEGAPTGGDQLAEQGAAPAAASNGSVDWGNLVDGTRNPEPRLAPVSSPPALRPAVGVTDLKGNGEGNFFVVPESESGMPGESSRRALN